MQCPPRTRTSPLQGQQEKQQRLLCGAVQGLAQAQGGGNQPGRERRGTALLKRVPPGAAACSERSLFSARCSSWPLAAPAGFPEVKPDNQATSSAASTVPLPEPGGLHHPRLSAWKDPSPEGSASGWAHTQSSPGGLILGTMRREMGHGPCSQHCADLPGFEIHQITGSQGETGAPAEAAGLPKRASASTALPACCMSNAQGERPE